MRYTGPKCRLCRREGKKLFLKGTRCETQKCAFVRHSDVPGKYGKEQRAKKTEYAIQLRAKQSAKRIYGMSESQFKIAYQAAAKSEGNTGENFQRLLETRLDNALYRAGLATSRSQARQIVGHGLLRCNEKRVKTPSQQVKIGDKYALSARATKSALFQGLAKQKNTTPKWLKADYGKLTFEVVGAPEITECEGIEAQIVVEFYSR